MSKKNAWLNSGLVFGLVYVFGSGAVRPVAYVPLKHPTPLKAAAPVKPSVFPQGKQQKALSAISSYEHKN